MFKVQNGTPGNLPVDLEQGSIILTPGKSFDLDPHCSRKWINTNPLLQKLLAIKALILIHDSEVGVPGVPTKQVIPIKPKDIKAAMQQKTSETSIKKSTPKPVKPKKIKKPKMINMADKDDVPIKKKVKKKINTKKMDDPVEKFLKEKSSKKSYFTPKKKTKKADEEKAVEVDPIEEQPEDKKEE
jgi:hypothetical protein